MGALRKVTTTSTVTVAPNATELTRHSLRCGGTAARVNRRQAPAVTAYGSTSNGNVTATPTGSLGASATDQYKEAANSSVAYSKSRLVTAAVVRVAMQLQRDTAPPIRRHLDRPIISF
jgi:hypothetical protein